MNGFAVILMAEPTLPGESLLADVTLDDFLAAIEKRAFAMARVAVRSHEDALEIVQDAMSQLALRYAQRDPGERRLLFYRILHNRINDTHRRRKIQSKIFAWLPTRTNDRDGGDEDPLAQFAGPERDNPAAKLENQQRLEAVQAAVGALPRRQREAFMLRCWEGLSTAESAAVMKCTEGSVKTHYSRALLALQQQLQEHRP